MRTERANVRVAERINAVASDLFYRQGYGATGINQLIAASGVAKASFYDHFPSKEHLLLAYARDRAQRELQALRDAVESRSDPYDRFFSALKVLVPWLKSTRFRGCPFQNLLAEVGDELPEIQDICRQHRENLLDLFREISRFLQQGKGRADAFDVEAVAQAYLILFEGAIAASVACRAVWPVDRAIEALKQIVAIRKS